MPDPERGAGMRRREFIMALGGAAAMPLAARAQERVRRIGVMASLSADDPVAQVRNAAFLQGLQQLGWTVGRNVRIDYRWAGTGDAARKHAAELAALAPDVILAAGSQATAPLLQTTRTIPVVFVHTPDPVGAGLVSSLARPGGNATGFTQFEYGIAGKWLELLKQIAPSATRAAVIRDPAITAGIGQWGAIQAVAPAISMQVVPVNVRDASEIERAVAEFARAPNGGLIVTGSGLAIVHLALIVKLAAQHKLPAVYYERSFTAAGGLVSYGADWSTNTGKRPATSIASSRARNRPICRCRRRPSTSWSSISRRRRRSALRCRRPCSPAPTR